MPLQLSPRQMVYISSTVTPDSACHFSFILSCLIGPALESQSSLNMDPMSVLGLASNMIQFIQFASNLIQGTQEIYLSVTGASSQNEHLDRIYYKLSELASSLPEQSHAKFDPHDFEGGLSNQAANLEHVATSCKYYCNSLLDVVSKLRLKPGDRRRPWKSFSKAVLEVWKREEIQQLQTQIGDAQRLMATYICAISRQVSWIQLLCFVGLYVMLSFTVRTSVL